MDMEEQISWASIDKNASVDSLLERQVERQSRKLACGIRKKF